MFGLKGEMARVWEVRVVLSLLDQCWGGEGKAVRCNMGLQEGGFAFIFKNMT